MAKNGELTANLTENETASLLNLKPQTLALWRTQGRGPKYLKLGRLVRYRPRDVEAWQDKHVVPTGQK